MPDWTFHLAQFDRADVAALLDVHFQAMESGSPADACHVLTAERLRDPDIRFWSLRDKKGVLLGIGAWKAIDDGHGEIKSMRTHDDALRRGVGRAILRHLIADAEAQEITRLSLETGGTPAFGPALALYEREGFEPCGPFGDYRANPFTRFMTRPLQPRLASPPTPC